MLYLGVRLLLPHSDVLLLPIVTMLTGIGLVMIFRLTYEIRGARDLALTQAIWILVGSGAMFFTVLFFRNYHRLFDYKYLLAIGAVALIASTFTPFGYEVNGARLWVAIGPVNFQPSEFARIALVIFFAGYLAEKRDVMTATSRTFLGVQIPALKYFGPVALVWAASLGLLVFEKDLGSSLLFFAVPLLMLYAATGRIAYVLLGAVLFSVGSLVTYLLFDHVQLRVQSWLDPWQDPDGAGLPDPAEHLQHRRRRPDGDGPRGGVLPDHPRGRDGLHLRRHRERDGAVRGDRGAAGVPGVRVPGDQDLPSRRGRVLEAPRLRAHGDVRPPDPGHRGRGDEGHTADWHHPALRLLRRLLGGRQLHPDGPAAGDLGEGRPPRDRRDPARGFRVNAHVRRTFYLFVAGFVALVGMLVYWQVYARESLANNPQNALQTQRAISTPRGLILAGDGETVLAESVRRKTPGGPVYDRFYPEGEAFSNVVGYWSIKYGATGIEIGQNSELSGTAEPATLDGLINQMSGGPTPGNNVVLTLDPELQRIAHEELASSVTGRGSVVAVDPNNGEILALATSPSYDPNNIDQTFPELSSDPDSPLIDRAVQSLYPPGSTFKVVTAAAALEAGLSPTQIFDDDGTYELADYTVVNYKGKKYGRVTFAEALVFSINAIFAKIGVEIVGAQRLDDTAYDFGFGDSYDDFSLPGDREQPRPAARGVDPRDARPELLRPGPGQLQRLRDGARRRGRGQRRQAHEPPHRARDPLSGRDHPRQAGPERPPPSRSTRARPARST